MVYRMIKRMTHSTTSTTINSTHVSDSALPTFLDHFQELKGRLFWVAVYFVVFSAAAYPFFDTIVKLIVSPLGHERLYYTTPAGGLSFIIKVCMYVGLIAVLPVVVYHLYKFISPVMQRRNARVVLGYTLTSIALAFLGVIFVYFISLPAALHFLTSIDFGQISPLLTIDAYISFVMAYLVAGVLLFQLPLFMLISNAISPLSPKKLFGSQRYVIVGAFVIAAIISPTPDVVNQTLLAAPMILMYQLGIVVVWLRQRRQRTTHLKQLIRSPHPLTAEHVSVAVPSVHGSRTATSTHVFETAKPVTSRRSIDGIITSRGTKHLAGHYRPRTRH